MRDKAASSGQVFADHLACGLSAPEGETAWRASVRAQLDINYTPAHGACERALLYARIRLRALNSHKFSMCPERSVF